MKKLILILTILSFPASVCRAIEPPDFFAREGIKAATSQVEIIIGDNVIKKMSENPGVGDTEEILLLRAGKTFTPAPDNIAATIKFIKSNENKLSTRELIGSYLKIAEMYDKYEMYDRARIFYNKARELDPSSKFLQKKSNNVYINISDSTYSYWSVINSAEQQRGPVIPAAKRHAKDDDY